MVQRMIERALMVGTILVFLFLMVQIYIVRDVRSPFAKPEYVRLGNYPDTQKYLDEMLRKR